jgi:hypothetical protein
VVRAEGTAATYLRRSREAQRRGRAGDVVDARPPVIRIRGGAREGTDVSRFGPVDPFYRAIEEAESKESIERLVRADAERYRRQMLAMPLPPPIADHDPGDEDRS